MMKFVSFRLFPLFVVEFLSVILWSNHTAVLAQVLKQGSAIIFKTITESPCIQNISAFGGPILAEIDGDVRIVAVNSAEYADQNTRVGVENYGMPMSRMMAAIEQATR
jgi:hypothetical protein